MATLLLERIKGTMSFEDLLMTMIRFKFLRIYAELSNLPVAFSIIDNKPTNITFHAYDVELDNIN
jgi:hypothetical protein